MKVLTDLNMNNNQIIEVIIHKVKSDPTISSKNEGMIIFNETDKKLKYCNGIEWIVIGSGSGTSITIDTSLSNESTNNNAAGSKAVVDYVKENTKDLSTFINTIKNIGNGKVLMKDDSGIITGIEIDTEVKENSKKLINSGSVYKAINGIKLTKTEVNCPAITGENGTCVWTIPINHSKPVLVQVYDKSGEICFPNIKNSTNQVIITFNGITNNKILAEQYYAVILSN